MLIIFFMKQEGLAVGELTLDHNLLLETAEPAPISTEEQSTNRGARPEILISRHPRLQTFLPRETIRFPDIPIIVVQIISREDDPDHLSVWSESHVRRFNDKIEVLMVRGSRN